MQKIKKMKLENYNKIVVLFILMETQLILAWKLSII